MKTLQNGAHGKGVKCLGYRELHSVGSLILIFIVIVIALCLQYELKGYPRKFLELLTGTPPHLTLNQVSYHSAESTEEIA